MTPAEMAREGRRLSNLLEAAEDMHREQVQAAADAERQYRKAKAEAWLRAPEGTAAFREAQVNGVTADERYRRDLAVGMERAYMQAILNRRQQISLLQSNANAYKAEAEFARYGPEAA